MALSRRTFVKTASVGGLGALTAPLIAARGSEALRGPWLDPEPGFLAPVVFASDERRRHRLSAPRAIRLDSNENPDGPGPAPLQAITAMFGETSRYPDMPAVDLKAAVARHQGVQPENVVLGCGSGEVLRMAVYAFTSPRRALVTAAPSFEDPVQHAEVLGTPVRAVPVDASLALDLGRMLDAASDAGMVYLCNPNNPTATVHGAADVREFVTQLNRRNPDCVVLVDEAYHEYVDDPSYATAVPLAMSNPRVLAVRTFSKVFGMAGLRAGYAIGQPDTLARLSRYRLPNNMNLTAAVAGAAALPDTAHIARERQRNSESREFTRRAFEGMGYQSNVSNANFIMVAIGRDALGFKKECAARGILVGRAFPPLTNYTRISIGTMAEMQVAVDVFRQVLTSATN